MGRSDATLARMSNFLGEVYASPSPTSILSGSELAVREGLSLQKGMTYRIDAPSVFLVLPHGGAYADEWHAPEGVYVFRGHDSVLAKTGKSADQVSIYESGRLSENGKFLKAARSYAEKLVAEPLAVRVYEKLDAGVWFDKGMFELVDASEKKEGEGRAYVFHLRPVAGALGSERYERERMLSATEKAAAWAASGGRCTVCGTETGLRFVEEAGGGAARLLCTVHRGEGGGLLG